MNKYIQSAKYLALHKYYVLIEGLKIGRFLILHDMSKFGIRSFVAHAKHWDFRAETCKEYIEYLQVRTHHEYSSKHHLQYWADKEVPAKYLKEILVDWIAVQRALGKKMRKGDRYYHTRLWWEETGHTISMHPNTRTKIKNIIYSLKG